VLDRVQLAWKETNEGQKYFQKAGGAVDSYSGGPYGSTSTSAGQYGGPQLSDSQIDRRFKSYFKNHAFVAFGGMLWLQFLIAVGDVTAPMIREVNALCRQRTLDRRGKKAGNKPDEAPGSGFLRREARNSQAYSASTPVPKPKDLRTKGTARDQ
jgi:hypothetical protein